MAGGKMLSKIYKNTDIPFVEMSFKQMATKSKYFKALF